MPIAYFPEFSIESRPNWLSNQHAVTVIVCDRRDHHDHAEECDEANVLALSMTIDPNKAQAIVSCPLGGCVRVMNRGSVLKWLKLRIHAIRAARWVSESQRNLSPSSVSPSAQPGLPPRAAE